MKDSIILSKERLSMLVIAYLLLASMAGFSQTTTGSYTAIPDHKFEQALIDKELDTILDEQVLTVAIDTVTALYITGQNIVDLTGIEAFTTLRELYCNFNALTSLNVSKNTGLTRLYCEGNELDSLDVSKNTELTELYCKGNNLTSLDLKNGSNNSFTVFNAQGNSDLACILVDNVNDSRGNWHKEDRASYGEACGFITPPIATIPASEVTSTSATFRADISADGGTPVTARGFVYSTSNEDLTYW